MVSTLDGKKITSLDVVKTIVLPDEYTKDETHLNSLQFALDNTLDYLDQNVKYTINEDRLIVKIHVDKNQIVMLDNISFQVNDDIQIKIDSPSIHYYETHPFKMPSRPEDLYTNIVFYKFKNVQNAHLYKTSLVPYFIENDTITITQRRAEIRLRRLYVLHLLI